jgi:D-glycero-D-manno-heptose 1,7-bisphosphate phosphatase
MQEIGEDLEVGKAAAVFLDRDGTINEEVGYLDSLEKLRIIPEAFDAIRLINQSGMKAVVISNQSGVARGYFDEAFVETVHTRIQALLKEHQAWIDRFYYCPHHPTEGIGAYRMACTCRKPEAGLLVRASQEMGIDLAHSYMVGDMPKDIEAAGKAGAKGILVQTGYGMDHLIPLIPPKNSFAASQKSFPLRGQPEVIMTHDKPKTSSLEGRKTFHSPLANHFSAVRPDYIARDILDAVTWIMKDRQT